MTDMDIDARQKILARLAQSRAELRGLLDPPPPGSSVGGDPRDTQFPRSRIMRALLSGRGLGAVGALASGLVIARPALALRLLRLVPATAIGKMLMGRLLAGLSAKHASSK